MSTLNTSAKAALLADIIVGVNQCQRLERIRDRASFQVKRNQWLWDAMEKCQGGDYGAAYDLWRENYAELNELLGAFNETFHTNERTPEIKAMVKRIQETVGSYLLDLTSEKPTVDLEKFAQDMAKQT